MLLAHKHSCFKIEIIHKGTSYWQHLSLELQVEDFKLEEEIRFEN